MIILYFILVYLAGIVTVILAGVAFGLAAKRHPELLAPMVKPIMQHAMRQALKGTDYAVSTDNSK